jgi:hypothetical protein
MPALQRNNDHALVRFVIVKLLPLSILRHNAPSLFAQFAIACTTTIAVSAQA